MKNTQKIKGAITITCMKSELVRNQMEMLAQNGGDLSGNNNEILSTHFFQQTT